MLNWIIFCRNSNIELNQFGYRSPLSSSSLEDVGASPPTLGASPPQITSSPKACRSPLLLWAHRPDLPPSPLFGFSFFSSSFSSIYCGFSALSPLSSLNRLLNICSIGCLLILWVKAQSAMPSFAIFNPVRETIFVLGNYLSTTLPIFFQFSFDSFDWKNSKFQSRHRLDGDEQESLSGGYVGRISAPGACLLLCPSCPLMSSMSPQTHATQFKLPFDILTWC